MALFLISGANGSDKEIITEILREQKVWQKCVSYTTRKKQKDEVEGDTYYFISNEEFNNMYKNGKFLRVVTYSGDKYAITQEQFDRVSSSKVEHVYAIVDYGGFKAIKDKSKEAIGIYISISKEEAVASLLNDGKELKDALAVGMAHNEDETNKAEYDYVIKNVRGRLDELVLIIRSIVLQNTLS